MQNLFYYLEKLINFPLRYTFNFLAVAYYTLIACYPEGQFKIMFFVGACTLLLFHNIMGKAKFSWLWIILFSFVISLNAYLAFVYKTVLNVNMLAAFVGTNAAEAESVLSGAALIVSAIFICTTALIYFSAKEFKDKRKGFSKRRAFLLIIIYCYTLSPFIFRRVLITNYRDYYVNAPIYTLQVATNYYSPLVYGNAMTVAAYLSEYFTFQQYKNAERVLADGISLDTTKEKVKTIYLVLGESATSGRMSLFGYDKPTTPFVDSLSRVDSLHFLYYKGIASASFTRNAVPAILSPADAKNPILFYEKQNLFDMAKAANYKTVWISNQPRFDLWDAGNNYVAHVTSSADETYYSERNDLNEDFALFPFIDNLKNDNVEYRFVGMHLAGSHYFYKDKFDDTDLAQLGGNANDLNDMYDLSLHHTDRFLKEFYNRYVKDDDSALLFYVSDHGEDVGNGLGHGFLPISRIQFEVPLLIFNQSPMPMDSLIHRYMQNGEFNNANSFFILAEAMGYTVDEDVALQAASHTRYVVHGDDSMHKYHEIEPYTLYEEK